MYHVFKFMVFTSVLSMTKASLYIKSSQQQQQWKKKNFLMMLFLIHVKNISTYYLAKELYKKNLSAKMQRM